MADTMAEKPPHLTTFITSKDGSKCPACKKKDLIRSDFIKVHGYQEKIYWDCIKCPDEYGCGFAVACGISSIKKVGEPLSGKELFANG